MTGTFFGKSQIDMGVDGCWCIPRSSKPLQVAKGCLGEFDSHISPPKNGLLYRKKESVFSSGGLLYTQIWQNYYKELAENCTNP